MTIFKRVFAFLVLALLFFGLAFLGVREFVMGKGTTTLKNSLRELVQVARANPYDKHCTGKGLSLEGGEKKAQIQLRFVSSSEYLLEVVCPGFAFEPIVIRQYELPSGVIKVPGNSGFVYSEENLSGVALEVFGELEKMVRELFPTLPEESIAKQVAVTLRESSIMIGSVQLLATAPQGPVTSCSGYGFYCCQEETEQGVGDQLAGLRECKSSCFAQCVPRPTVLALNTNPFFDDAKNRLVVVSPGSTVEFLVVTSTTSEVGTTATFDFGDGESAISSDLSIPTPHVFSCATTSCSYVTTVTLTDAQGVRSVASPISTVTVRVE